MSKGVVIGTATCIVTGIATTRDGAAKLTLELNPQDSKIITQLMNRFLLNKTVVEIGIVGIEGEG